MIDKESNRSEIIDSENISIIECNDGDSFYQCYDEDGANSNVVTTVCKSIDSDIVHKYVYVGMYTVSNGDINKTAVIEVLNHVIDLRIYDVDHVQPIINVYNKVVDMVELVKYEVLISKGVVCSSDIRESFNTFESACNFYEQNITDDSDIASLMAYDSTGECIAEILIENKRQLENGEYYFKVSSSLENKSIMAMFNYLKDIVERYKTV